MTTTEDQPTPPGPDDGSIVPAGAYFFPVESFDRSRRFAFLLLPEFTLLAFSSALEPLRIANQLAQEPLYRWDVLSQDGAPVRSSSGIEVGVDGDIASLSRDRQILVCSGNNGLVAATDATLAALRRHHRMGGAVGGICTGAMTLARAGLLGRSNFTLHWENQPAFDETFPDLTPSSRGFETENGVLTCGGGAAAADMMVWAIAQDFGENFAIAVSDMCLLGSRLEPRPEQRSSIATAIATRNPRIVQIVRAMHENIETPLSLEEMAKAVGLSRRQVERQFRQVMGKTPMTIYRNIRLDRARSMFAETDMTVSEVSLACGFGLGSGFARHYRTRFGVSPSAFRRQNGRDAPG